MKHPSILPDILTVIAVGITVFLLISLLGCKTSSTSSSASSKTSGYTLHGQSSTSEQLSEHKESSEQVDRHETVTKGPTWSATHTEIDFYGGPDGGITKRVKRDKIAGAGPTVAKLDLHIDAGSSDTLQIDAGSSSSVNIDAGSSATAAASAANKSAPALSCGMFGIAGIVIIVIAAVILIGRLKSW